MICKICENENRCPYYICYRCINTSPNLLLPWRFKLLKVKAIRDELSERVNSVLEEGLNESKGMIGKDGVNIVSLLGSQLQRVQVIKEVRRNNKIKQNIYLMETQLDKKRQEILRLKQLLQDGEKEEKELGKSNSFDATTNEWKGKIDLINTFVHKQQDKKLLLLNRWFGLIDNYTFNEFKLFHQPVITIAMIKENNNNDKITSSLRISLKYIEVVGEIFYIHLPYPTEMNDINIDVEYGIGLLVYCCHLVCSKLQLLPTDRYNNIRVWLQDYGLDEILYHISRREIFLMKEGRAAAKQEDNCLWTLPMIQDYIEDTCSDNGGRSGSSTSSRFTNIMASTRDTVVLSSSKSARQFKSTPNNINHNRMIHLHNQRVPQGTNPNKPALFDNPGDNPFRNDPTTRAKSHSNTTKSRANTTTSPPDRWFVVG